jgi:cysteinyl-tRNA synthetase, unknown class
MIRRLAQTARRFTRTLVHAILLTAIGIAASAPLALADDPVVQGMKIRSWGYQLQNDDTTIIERSPYDVVVIDFQRDPSLGGPFKPAELARMKKKPDGSRRLVIAYISIGEAEDYRYYWGDRSWADQRNRTPLIEKVNPEWVGNFTVKFWEQEWQNLVLNDEDSYINRIIDAGFDGIYMDKVDICEFYQEKGGYPAGTVPSDLMIQFVAKISNVSKARNPNFLIIAQNAEFLLPNAFYRSKIDGIAKESLLFNLGTYNDEIDYPTPRRNDSAQIKGDTDLLKLLRNDGKLVLCVEYINVPNLMDKATVELGANGFVPYYGIRRLNKLRYAEVFATP